MSGLVDAHVRLFLDAGPTPRQTYLAASPRRASRRPSRTPNARWRPASRCWWTSAHPSRTSRGTARQPPRIPVPSPGRLAGPPITRRGGHCHFWGGEVATESDVAAAVEARVALDAGIVKVTVSGGGLTPGTDPAAAELPANLLNPRVPARPRGRRAGGGPSPERGDGARRRSERGPDRARLVPRPRWPRAVRRGPRGRDGRSGHRGRPDGDRCGSNGGTAASRRRARRSR